MKKIVLLVVLALLLTTTASASDFGVVINPEGTFLFPGAGEDTGCITHLDYLQNVKFTGLVSGEYVQVKANGGTDIGWVFAVDVE